jgi:SAM-dependent methyltransferase
MPNEINITGWDFSQLTETGRMRETPLPWDYHAIVKQYMNGVIRMLDMGTGGGEFLRTLAPLPEETYATEGYEPNVRIAEENLKPLNVKVISGYKDDALPLENDFFDLVINRHEYYDPGEVNRILKSGGFFITQQVKGNCDDTIIELFGTKTEIENTDWCLNKAVMELQINDFEIINHNEAEGFTEFKDTEALVSYLKVINWIVPEFTKEKYSAELNKAREVIEANGSFRSTLDRFLIVSKKLT